MQEKGEKGISGVSQEVMKTTEDVLGETERLVNVTADRFEQSIDPVRKNILKRFPVLFLLAVTFGFTAIVTGIEQLLIQYDILQNHPVIILMLGIVILIVTGTLYKKLG